MSKFSNRTYRLRQPQRHAEQKFNTQGNRKNKGLTVCKDCKHILFKKEWTHPEEFNQYPKNLQVQYSLCPACVMTRNNLFEGEILIKDVPRKMMKELANLIAAYGKRAMIRDSQHRIIKIIKLGETTWRILTSENQLAVRLAKKISDAFRGGTLLHISRGSEAYEADRVQLAFI